MLVLLCPEETLAGTEVPPKAGFFGQFEAAPAFLTATVSGTGFLSSLGYATRLGYRWGMVDVFVQVGHDVWFDSDLSQRGTPSVLNVGLGLGVVYFDGRVRSAIAFGSSTMLFDDVIEDAGTTGLFVEIRPASIRWPVYGWLTIELHPLALLVEVPSTEHIPVIRASFVTVLALEWR